MGKTWKDGQFRKNQRPRHEKNHKKGQWKHRVWREKTDEKTDEWFSQRYREDGSRI